MAVVEYKCPLCGGRLEFDPQTQMLKCPFCEGTFEVAQLENGEAGAFGAPAWDALHEKAAARRLDAEGNEVAPGEAGALVAYCCPSCGGEIVGDATVAATHCPYCDSPAVVPGQLEGTFEPDLVIPFKTTREDAQAAFAQNCRRRWLLPKGYASEQRLEEIVGMYVPFWLYDCTAGGTATFDAHDDHQHGDRTIRRHYRAERSGRTSFSNVPADASSQMDDTMMESVEPYDCSEAKPFTGAYLSGYVANRYDVEPDQLAGRIQQRAEDSLKDLLKKTVDRDSVSLQNFHGHCEMGAPRYALFPVWTLASNYKGEVYHFTMNGQTGKLTGRLPVSTGRTVALFLIMLAVGFLLGLAGSAVFLDDMSIGVAGGIGAVLAAIVTFAVRSGMNTHVAADGCCDYMDESGLTLTHQHDQFRYEEVIEHNTDRNDD